MTNEANDFNTVQFEQVLGELYPTEYHAELRQSLIPLMSMQGRLPAYILKLARGNQGDVQKLIDLAQQDWRDVIVLVENREEFGLDRDPELDEFARRFTSGHRE